MTALPFDRAYCAAEQGKAHGEHCSCRLLAYATGASDASIDYRFCRRVLQSRWDMHCDHLPDRVQAQAPAVAFDHDARDPLHATLLVNLYVHDA